MIPTFLGGTDMYRSAATWLLVIAGSLARMTWAGGPTDPPPSCVGWSEHTLTPRTGHAMAYDSKREVVVLFGGDDHDYDGQTWEWNGRAWRLAATTGPSPRSGAIMAFDTHRGVTVLYGGVGGQAGDDTWEWDGAQWSLRATRGPALREGAMAYDSTRQVMVFFGGLTGTPLVGETWEWNGEVWALRSDSGPSPRSRVALAYDPIRARTTLFGGRGESANMTSNETWVWDGIQWALAANAGPSPRCSSAMAFDAAIGRLVLFGGTAASGTSQVGDTWEWNGVSWSQVQGLQPPARREHTLAYDTARGQLVRFGGRTHPQPPSDLWGDTWTRTAAGWLLADLGDPLHRQNHAMAYDSSRGVMVMFGGDLHALAGDTWEYSVAAHSWSRRATSSGPSPRVYPAMAFDSHRNVTVLFGGVGGYGGTPAFGDTWEWNGNTWTLRTPANGPSPRAAHAMVFDDARGVTVLYGADGPEGPGRETWEGDGTPWSLRGTHGPVGRSAHAMAYDRYRGVTVLFGGNGSSGIQRETWEWDGVLWTLRTNQGPPSRTLHGMAYDTRAHRVVMFGGYPHDQDRVWTWDGDLWVAAVSHGPKATDSFAMAFDSAREATVLFGGYVSNETWELRLLLGPEIVSVTLYNGAEIGQPVDFHVKAIGAGMIEYQWRHNGVNLFDGPSITGATTPTLTIAPQSIADEGSYDVLVTDSTCTQASRDVWLNVITSTGDVNGDGQVNVDDLILVILNWGWCPFTCAPDLNEDGQVDVDDLIFVILHWTG